MYAKAIGARDIRRMRSFTEYGRICKKFIVRQQSWEFKIAIRMILAPGIFQISEEFRV